MTPPLSSAEFSRYARHFSLDNIGISGQVRLKQASILCLGAGGIGSAALLYLTAAGIGKIGIADHDIVELSNLQRQVLYQEQSIGKAKAQQVQQHLSKLNSNVNVTVINQKIDPHNAEQMFKDFDIIVDGTDNFETRYIASHFSAILNKPLVSASVFKFTGQLSVFNYNNGPCYRCLYPTPPPKKLIPNCAQAGVLGAMTGIMGTMAANETLKIILDIGDVLSGKLALFDSLSCELKHFLFPKNTHCPLCSNLKNATIPIFDEPQHQPCKLIEAVTLKNEIDNQAPLILIDVRETWERQICDLPTAIDYASSDINTFIAKNQSNKQTKIIVYCKSGTRSATAAQTLQQNGFTNVYSLQGGIKAWITYVDHNLTQY